MKTNKLQGTRFSLLALAVIALWSVWSAPGPVAAVAQDDQPTADAPAEDTPAEDTPAEESPAEDPPAEDPPAEDTPAEETPEDEPADDSSAEVTSDEEVAEAETAEPTATDAEATEDAAPAGDETETPAADTTTSTPVELETESGWTAAGRGILLLLVGFVLPIFLGNIIASNLGMPDHGWKIAVVLLSLSIGGFCIYQNDFKLGADLGGGFNLVYDLKDPKKVSSQGEPTDDSDDGDQSFTMDELRAALKLRLDPNGLQELTIRQIGESIEIVVPNAGDAEKRQIKDKITALGQLEFRILVDSERQDNDTQRRIRLALATPVEQDIVEDRGAPLAEWVSFDPEELSDLVSAGIFVTRQGAQGPQVLVERDFFDVNGEYLTEASKDFGLKGPEVRFRFNAEGARLFGKLTAANLPDPRTGRYRHLGIILDGQLLTYPVIRDQISKEGTISGDNMDEEEVERVVSILDAGSLPAELSEFPISEESTSPTIGKLTIEQGKRAITISLVLVLVFILVYYRFAGLVACLALALNLFVVIACMLQGQAHFTLPGLAGLVLTVGMSVDANVLIFERIREELARGTTLRMAIRNGFGRATTTIVDANVTTIIAAIVLFIIGTDTLRSFAITLFLGIVASMYTAIFCSRILFDIAEQKGWITKLSMTQLLTNSNIDFMGKWRGAAVFSSIIILLGLAGAAYRGTDILNMDFTGGTSVSIVFDEAISIADVREALDETPLGKKNLVVVAKLQEAAEGSGNELTRYKINCSVLDDEAPEGESAVSMVEGIIAKAFAGKLQTYKVKVVDQSPYTSGEGDAQTPGLEAKLFFGEESGADDTDGVSHDQVEQQLQASLAENGHKNVTPFVTNDGYTEGSSHRYQNWTVRIGLPESEAQKVLDTLVTELNAKPQFPQSNKIGKSVAGDLKWRAIQAIVVSLIGIVGYVWIRFQKLSFGLAAVAALVHDVLVTLGMIAVSKFLVDAVPSVAAAIQVDAFQISLTIVAAFLTLIGYSLNDTIVVFDRVREVRGKSPTISADMLNTSINQTLSRTILTSGTTLIVVLILYLFGGDGIHGFAFSLLVGVIVGTYSSIFIASPLLLWMAGLEQKTSPV